MNIYNYKEVKDWRVDRDDFYLSEQVAAKRYTGGVVAQKVLDVYAVCPDGKKNLINRKVIRLGISYADMDKVFGIENETLISAKTLFDTIIEPDNLKLYTKIITELEVGYTSMDSDADLEVKMLDKDLSSYFGNDEKVADVCNQLLGKADAKNKQEVKAIVKHNQSFEKAMFGAVVAPTNINF